VSGPAAAGRRLTIVRARWLGADRLIQTTAAGRLVRTLNLPLVAIVLGAYAALAHYTGKVSEWLVMSDELQHAKLAINVGKELSPLPSLHGEYVGAWSQLYPLLTAPVYQLFDMPTAFQVVHLLNAALMASTAIPAYLLAREVVSQRLAAYAVAGLSVIVPWIAMAAMVMTEPAAYPAFVWAILAIQRAVAEPSVGRDLLALAGVTLAFLARTQFIVLALVLPVVVVLHEVGFAMLSRPRGHPGRALMTGLRRALLEHRVLVGLGMLGLLATVPLLASGSAGKLLGNYQTTTETGKLLPAGIHQSVAAHLDFVAVGVGVLPMILAAAWALSTVLRPLAKRGHAFAVLTVVLVPTLAYEVASFIIRFASGGTQDRYLFYIAPLLFVGMAAALATDNRRPWGALLAAGAGFAWLAGFAEYAPSGGPFFGSPASAFHGVLDGQAWRVGRLLGIHELPPATVIASASVVAAIALAALIRHPRIPRALLLVATTLVVGTYCAVETRYVLQAIVLGSNGGRAGAGRSVEGRDWIDRALSRGASAAIMPSPEGSFAIQALWWETEFWNKTVDQAYAVTGSSTYTPFPHAKLSIDLRTGMFSPAGNQHRYLVVNSADVRFRPEGRTVAISGSLNLIDAVIPYRARWASIGVQANNGTIARRARLRIFNAGRRPVQQRVALTLMSAGEIRARRRYLIETPSDRRRGSLDLDRPERVAIDLCVPPTASSDVTIAATQADRHGDGRLIGVRLAGVDLATFPDSCRPD